MPKQKGIIKIKGSMGGITFYQRNGQDLSREQNGPEKSKIENDPNFVRTRENNQEFGGAATIGKALRVGLVQEFEEMADVTAVGRITKLMKKIISMDLSGIRGQRSFIPTVHRNVLMELRFSERVSFDSIFLAPYTASVTSSDRNEVTITLPPFDSGNFVNAPSGATHFRIINLISVLSQYIFNTATKKYAPTDQDNNSKNAFNASGYFHLGSSTSVPVDIVSTLPGSPILPPTSVLVSCIGIEFYQEVGGNFYLLSSDNAMKIQNVY